MKSKKTLFMALLRAFILPVIALVFTACASTSGTTTYIDRYDSGDVVSYGPPQHGTGQVGQRLGHALAAGRIGTGPCGSGRPGFNAPRFVEALCQPTQRQMSRPMPQPMPAPCYAQGRGAPAILPANYGPQCQFPPTLPRCRPNNGYGNGYGYGGYNGGYGNYGGNGLQPHVSRSGNQYFMGTPQQAAMMRAQPHRNDADWVYMYHHNPDRRDQGSIFGGSTYGGNNGGYYPNGPRY